MPGQECKPSYRPPSCGWSPDESAVHGARILRTLPHADERDVARVVALLVEDGYLEAARQRAGYFGVLAPVTLTARGRDRLQK